MEIGIEKISIKGDGKQIAAVITALVLGVYLLIFHVAPPVQQVLNNWSNFNTGAGNNPTPYSSSGGNVTYDGNYTMVTFYSNGTLNVTGTIPNATILLVGGGGGGGSGGSQIPGGSGGAGGGVYYITSYDITGNQNVIVGDVGASCTSICSGGNGGNSSFGSLVAEGGGGGLVSLTGGSVGNFTGSGGCQNPNTGPIFFAGGGGAGAGGNGTAGVCSYGSFVVAGGGGPPVTYAINGTAVNYSRGGDGTSAYVPGNPGGAAIGSKGIVIIRYLTYIGVNMISATIQPWEIYPNRTMLGYCYATTFDGLNVTYNYSWYENGILNRSGTYNSTLQGVNTNVANISGSELTIGQNWSLNCTVFDTHGLNESLISGTKTVLPTPSIEANLSVGISALQFRPTHAYQQNVSPVNQTDIVPLYVVYNAENRTIFSVIRATTMINGFQMFCSPYPNMSNSVYLTNVSQIILNMTALGNAGLWCKANFNAPSGNKQNFSIIIE